MSSSHDERNLRAILTIHPGSGPKFAANLRALITGASGGVGYACARAFAAKGVDLISSDVDPHTLELALSNLRPLGRFCDVASEAIVAGKQRH